jgi:hypothetical protein
MNRFAVFLFAGILTGCAVSEQKKSEAPLRESFETYGARMQAVPEFARAGEMRKAGHQYAGKACRLLRVDDVIYELDKAIECFSKAADLYFEGKVKHPEFSEYVDEELDLTYKFKEECVRERPFLINPIRGGTLHAGELTEEQKRQLESMYEKIRQYEAALMK